MANRKESESRPQISQITPTAAIPGGELQIRGKGLVKISRPHVTIGEIAAPVVIGSESFVVVRVPEGATDGELSIGNGSTATSARWTCHVGVQIADSLHPVANPAIDAQGNIFTSFSGSRGQKTPVSVYRIDTNYRPQPFVTDIMNATGLTFDGDGMLYVSSRYDGVIYQVTPSGNMSVYAEGMGVATGLAFDDEGNLYVGDRSGTVFKISRSRQIYVFATLEPSIAAYHLAFGPENYLYVSGPTTSSYDSIHRISHSGDVEVFFRGVGRPQGLAFDAEGRMYVAASYGGRRGVLRIGEDREPELFLSGLGIVGLAFTPSRAMVVATSNALYRVDVNVPGRRLC